MSMKTGMIAATALAFATTAAAQPASPAGAWITQSRNLEIAIAPCAAALCGDVTRVLGNASMTAAGGAMKAAPANVGQRILSNLTPHGDGWRGKIYNRENGRTYDCAVRRLANGDLEVRPYVALPLFGQTQIWKAAS